MQPEVGPPSVKTIAESDGTRRVAVSRMLEKWTLADFADRS
jgi:hypothetical protein